MSFGETGKEKEKVNHAKLFCVINGTTDEFRFRQSIKIFGFGEKANRESILCEK